MDENKNKKNVSWIRLASKSRPGLFYMFNTTTGEAKWEKNKTNDDQQKNELEPSLSACKTPAQDRLKTLQHSLKTNQSHSHSSKNSRQSPYVEAKTKTERENNLKNELSTCSVIQEYTKSPRKLVKRQHCSISSADTGEKIKHSNSGDNRRIIFSEAFDYKTSTEYHPDTEDDCASSKSLVMDKSAEHFGHREENTTSTFNNSSQDIICKLPFNSPQKMDSEKSIAKDITSTNPRTFVSLRENVAKGFTRTESTKPSRKSLNGVSELSKPQKLSQSSRSRMSVNTRLGLLRQSLVLQQLQQGLLQQQQRQQGQQSPDNINARDMLYETPKLSSESTNKSNTTLPDDKTADQSNSTNISLHIANNIINDVINFVVTELEAMDWLPILNESTEMSSTDSSLIIEKSKKCTLPTLNSEKRETMGELFYTVNDNLLRLSAKKRRGITDPNKKWKKNFFYFIVDTNVLLKHLCFVDELTKMKLYDTEGSMLYIPYSVLQELDVLKTRSGGYEGVKSLAVHVIKYLNSKFESGFPYLNAQSALDEQEHLIDIKSADDSILNCCLQAGKHISNLLLLTEDVNLRNKAISNHICVSSKTDLVSKCYDISSTNHKS